MLQAALLSAMVYGNCMIDSIASRTMIGIKPSGEEIEIQLNLGKPYQVDDVSWACPIEIIGLYQKLSDVQGVDSYQALSLAQSLARGLLISFIEKGGKLLWPDDRTEVTINKESF